MQSLYVYECGPIDSWNGWHLLDRNDVGGSASKLVGDRSTDPDESPWFGEEVAKMLEEARSLAKEHLLYEGDYRQGPFLSVIPDPAGSQSLQILAWKQDNNGTTYIASPVPFAHIDREEYSRVVRTADGKVRKS